MPSGLILTFNWNVSNVKWNILWNPKLIFISFRSFVRSFAHCTFHSDSIEILISTFLPRIFENDLISNERQNFLFENFIWNTRRVKQISDDAELIFQCGNSLTVDWHLNDIICDDLLLRGIDTISIWLVVEVNESTKRFSRSKFFNDIYRKSMSNKHVTRRKGRSWDFFSMFVRVLIEKKQEKDNPDPVFILKMTKIDHWRSQENSCVYVYFFILSEMRLESMWMCHQSKHVSSFVPMMMMMMMNIFLH